MDTVETDALLDNILDRPLQTASQALPFMIRGTRSSLQAVVATYGTKVVTADLLYHRFWDDVASSEHVGLHVLCCVSDGASINGKFYKLNKSDYPKEDVTFRARKLYAVDQQPLYFISDSCHLVVTVSDSCYLVKTTRNCIQNSGVNRNQRRLVNFNHCKISERQSHFRPL